MPHAVPFMLCSIAVPGLLVTLERYMQFTKANAPSWGRALAEIQVSASNHGGLPCTTGQSQLNE